ncbi:MAG: hypothetical protein ACLFN5_02395 [bacterium]
MTNNIDARKFLQYAVIALCTILFLPLVFEPRFRKMVALALLGLLYSWFLVNSWERLTQGAYRRSGIVGRLLSKLKAGKIMHGLIPLKAWGTVPFIIQSLLLVFFLVFGVLLAPLYYEIMRNPVIQNWVRDFFQTTAPEVFRFVNELTFSVDPYQVLIKNAQQVFQSLNSFFSTFLLPVWFIFFTALGAAIYDAGRKFLIRAEGSAKKNSAIMDTYSKLLGEYLVFNSIYYILLGIVIAAGLIGLNYFEITFFERKIILGLIMVFFLGNLVVPGLGTLLMAVLITLMVYLWQGLIGGIITGGVFLFYFTMDDYLIKPLFLAWLGASAGGEWDFGVETLVLGMILLYAAFGLVGFLLLFPGLCFIDAYLRNQYPGLRSWLRPFKTLTETSE